MLEMNRRKMQPRSMSGERMKRAIGEKRRRRRKGSVTESTAPTMKV